MWGLRNNTKFWLESLKGRDHSEDLGVNERTTLKCILGKYVERVWIEFIWLSTGIGGGSYEFGNKYSGSIKDEEFLD
jgi:hypothetical protein